MKLTKKERDKIIEEIAEATELDQEHFEEMLIDGFKGYKNYTDEELIDLYSYINPTYKKQNRR